MISKSCRRSRNFSLTQIAGSAWLLIGLALVFFAGYLVTALTVWKRKRTARLITTILIAIAYIPLIVAVILLVLSRFGLSLFGGLAGGITTWISDLIAQWHEAPEMLTETVTEIFATDHAGTLISAIGSMFSIWALLLFGVLVFHTVSVILLWVRQARAWFGTGQVL